MKRKIIRESDCDSPRECCKLFQQLFDNRSETDEYNAKVAEYNRKVYKENKDA